MKVNLISQTSVSSVSGRTSIPVSLTIRPACGLPGEYQYPTDIASLMRMLRLKTDLPATVLHRFEGELLSAPRARLLGVELSERVLTDIGYFVD